ncbi:DoxX family protein [Fibrella forsythiae]|uniref:DoxX family protein n=1 Tax=Fibrella forsythiae TaxID=2817061 RepID=A0ABS3JHT4_9BACT|nr:DoxX family protein [Fibrella forsythiae]MBO0949571.1 DoxX family protein [Fibrella forsythiae]
MTSNKRPSKVLHITLWIVQILLSVSLIWASLTKLFQPIAALSAMWPWTGQLPIGVVRATGLVDLLGGLGLVLPSLLRIRPGLTSITAGCVVLLMICAAIFHVVRGEAAVIGVNIVFALMAAFVAWGRGQKAHIAAN